jgi:hypothetical protein
MLPRPPDPPVIPERQLETYSQADLDAYLLNLRQRGSQHARYVEACADALDKLLQQSKQSPVGRIVGAGGFWAGIGWGAWTLDIIGVGLGTAVALAGAIADRIDRDNKARLREPERRRLIEADEGLRRIESAIAAAERVYARKGWSLP